MITEHEMSWGKFLIVILTAIVITVLFAAAYIRGVNDSKESFSPHYLKIEYPPNLPWPLGGRFEIIVGEGCVTHGYSAETNQAVVFYNPDKSIPSVILRDTSVVMTCHTGRPPGYYNGVYQSK